MDGLLHLLYANHLSTDKPKDEHMILLVIMGWIHLMLVLVFLNIHEICLKLKSRFRIIHKFPTFHYLKKSTGYLKHKQVLHRMENIQECHSPKQRNMHCTFNSCPSRHWMLILIQVSKASHFPERAWHGRERTNLQPKVRQHVTHYCLTWWLRK
jgi:hypothetical protein